VSENDGCDRNSGTFSLWKKNRPATVVFSGGGEEFDVPSAKPDYPPGTIPLNLLPAGYSGAY
jgi:hypothetical protein